MNTFYLDIAVLCQEYSKVDFSCDSSIITVLDEINISKRDFLTIFYPRAGNFGIDKTVVNNSKYAQFISFEPKHRTVKSRPFYLLEQVFTNIETSLCLTRNCFTTSSKIELSNEFATLKTLCDLNCCSVVSSLPWDTVEEILNNYKMNNTDFKTVFVISIAFKTPTQGVKDTVIQFNYNII